MLTVGRERKLTVVILFYDGIIGYFFHTGAFLHFPLFDNECV